MAGIARLVIRLRRLVVGAWIVLTFVGMFSAAKLSDRWFESFSIPGYSAYEANQRTLKAFGSGEQPPLVAVFTAPGKDITKVPGIQHAIGAASRRVPGSRVGSWFDTQQRHVPVAGPAHDGRDDLPAGERDLLELPADRRGARGAPASDARRA